MHNTVSKSGLHAIFHCFEQVVILNKFQEQVVEVEQKIIIRNNKLLFQFSDHNNNLLFKNYGKVRARSLFLIRSRGSSIKLYFFSCCIFFHRNFEMRFFASENSGLVYTPRKLHVVFSYKIKLLRPEREKISQSKRSLPF